MGVVFLLWRGSRSEYYKNLLRVWSFGFLYIFAGAFAKDKGPLVSSLSNAAGAGYDWYLCLLLTQITGVNFHGRLFITVLSMSVPLAVIFNSVSTNAYLITLPFTLASAFLPFFTVGEIAQKMWKQLSVIQKGFAVFLILDGIQTLAYPFVYNHPQLSMMYMTAGFTFGIAMTMFGPAAVLEKIGHDKADLESSLRHHDKIAQNKRLAALGEMAGGVAHEVNNPLAIAKMIVQLIKKNIERGMLTEKFLQEKTEQMDEAINRITTIVSGLASFSKAGSTAPKGRVSLKSIITEALEVSKRSFEGSDIKIEVRGDLDHDLYCHQLEITQALLNLINNSRDSLKEVHDKRIILEVKQLTHSDVISITDTGKGISDEIRDKIFHPFFTTKDIGEGTGLGLSISKGIADSHGGSLQLDPQSKETKFVLTLPRSL